MFRVVAGGFLVVATMTQVMAADLIIEEPVYEAAMAASHDWSGAYIGVHGGYLWGSTEAPYSDDNGGPLNFGNDPFDFSGWLAGAHIGANFHSGSVAGGVEALFDYAPFSGDDGGEGGDVNGLDGQFLGTLAGRIGFASDSLFVYLSGGGAVLTAEGTAPGETDALTFYGGTVGAGAEAALSEAISVRLDYRYYLFAQQVASFPDGGYDIGYTPSFHTVTAGLSFAF